MNLSLSLYKNHANPHVLGVKNAYIFRIVDIHHKVRFFYYKTVANVAIKFKPTKKNIFLYDYRMFYLFLTPFLVFSSSHRTQLTHIAACPTKKDKFHGL
jgi:hypothetical protein